MEEAVYHIKIHSVSRTIISYTLIQIPALTLLGGCEWLIVNLFIYIIMLVVVMLLSVFLSSRIGMARMKIILTANGILHIWERRFIFSREEKITIPWEIVDTYVFEEFKFFDSFTINFTNNKRYKFYRFSLFPARDDFKRFLNDFPTLSNAYRKAIPPDGEIKPIVEGERIFDYKYIRWFFLFLFALMVVLFVAKFL